ncbi:DUF4136 domain-containing protein [Noviherbaspirillum galbum]|uniref:DUF4136 domain-containing protein n=1 Tax=Noviherbaspirillum galbum TaxID=2709383 RepID=A0A6B3SV36_9BURK|nr:DUF4136 domain-containing protein [Noviherbaspirillum galbum]NEX64381.1 DUF4136 domain-containing protein [Noviherbaspirillum galbum]
MKPWVIALAALSVLLSGCASYTVKSNVTAFHEWPAAAPEKTYVFERTKEQNDSLEYRNYENLVRGELARLGFKEASTSQAPWLKAMLDYRISVRDVREIYPVAVGPSWPGPYWGPYWRGRYYRGYYPYYDPFWYGPPIIEQREANYQVFTRQLHVLLSQAANGKRLYEVTVVSEGGNGNLAAIMPYMVRSAFSDFPGKSGVPHVVELKMEEPAGNDAAAPVAQGAPAASAAAQQ